MIPGFIVNLFIFLLFPKFAFSTPECSSVQPCQDGSCCSKWGFCGYGNTFCGIGCLSNCDNSRNKEPPETPCSRERPCPDGSCCSKWGFCGRDAEFCGRGCLSNCNQQSKKQPQMMTTGKVEASDNSQDDAECSKTSPCENGECCSKWGHCGLGEEFCGKGCLSNCDNNDKPEETQCSETDLCPGGACCSKWGFCGYGPEHCGPGCLSNCDKNEQSPAKNNKDKTVISKNEKPQQEKQVLPVGGCSKDRPCSDGSCCGKWGFCGTTAEFCGPGCMSNCPQPASRNGKKTTEPARCSRTRPCVDGSCCSQSGLCGYGVEFCGRGCLSNCNQQSKKQPQTITGKVETTDNSQDDAECSKTQPCENGECCSKWGHCGLGEEFCGKGCLSNCDNNDEPEGYQCSETDPCPEGACCSKWGFCGYGPEHCGPGCLSNCDRNEQSPAKNNKDKTVISKNEKPQQEKQVPDDGSCSKDRPCSDASCCGKWGFCGTTAEFCGPGCLSNCQQPAMSRNGKKTTDPARRCSRTRPCADGSCCSQSGLCGYGVEFCGRGCISNCHAPAPPTPDEQQCSDTKPCPDGSCCSKWGFCGYGAEFCSDGCLSNCNANRRSSVDTTECGRFAPAGRHFCPLNICCSQFGYCGTTAEFCRSGCQSNCEKPPRAHCPNARSLPLQRVIGYYASWSLDPTSRKCGIIAPEKVNPNAYTHIIVSFATIEDNKLTVTESDKDLIKRFVQLKRRNPKLKVMVAVGGWAFNDEPTHKIFTRTTSDVNNRAAFASSAVDLLDSLGIDGLDVDWEYPVAEERGGEPEDRANYVLLLKELRRHFSHRLVLSVAAPASYWYLRHFDLLQIGDIVDWINVMSYDMHGVWDSLRIPYVFSHTNLSEIEAALDIYYRAGLRPEQLNLGLAFYARTFRLADPSCSLPGCPFNGPAEPGPCTNNAGTLSYHEIVDLLAKDPELLPRFDKDSASKLLVWEDQWMGYDDAETVRLKLNFVRSQCLGGVMVWSIDQDDSRTMILQNTLLHHARKPSAISPASPSSPARGMTRALSLTRQKNFFSRFFFPYY